MKKTITKFFICSLVLAVAILSARLYRIKNTEILDTSVFTDYFQLNESDNGGLELILESFTTLKKEYDFSEKIVKPIETVKLIEYKVASGDTLEKIANKFNISVDTIKINNKNARTGKLKVGETLSFTSQDGFYYKIKKNDTISKIAKLYGIKAADIINFNDIDPKKLKAGAKIFLKGVSYKKFMEVEQAGSETKKKVNTDSKKGKTGGSLSSPSGTSSSGFAYPVKFSGVASPFGNRFHPVLKKYILHTGVDFIAKYIPLRASKEGVVTFAGNMSGYGKIIIIIKHNNGYETRYAHLSVISTKVGEHVNKGDLIGKTGASGRVTGPHLHFEIRKDGVPKNPMKYL